MPDAASRSTVEILETLVSFDTTSSNSNLPLIDWIADYLDQHGVSYHRSHDPSGSKANLHAMIGPQVEGGLALSGHVDTVPVEGQQWSRDPFALHEQDGKLYARGTCDMKGFVASCLAAVPHFKASNLRRPVHLFISYGEEVDCGGARVLVRDMQASRLAPRLCIVGEPSGMKPIIAHKGRLSARVTVRGRPGHSSQPAQGVNAIHAAAEAIAWIIRRSRHLASSDANDPGGSTGSDPGGGTGFDPPHSTIHTGLIKGGAILNIIPERCSFEMEWRTIPRDDPQAELRRLQDHVAAEIEGWMHAIDPASGFEFEVLDVLPPLSIDPAHELVDLVKQATGANHCGKVSYGTEAGIYQNAGIESIVCGPGHIAQAHQPDEWVARDQLDACDAFLRRITQSLARTA